MHSGYPTTRVQQTKGSVEKCFSTPIGQRSTVSITAEIQHFMLENDIPYYHTLLTFDLLRWLTLVPPFPLGHSHSHITVK